MSSKEWIIAWMALNDEESVSQRVSVYETSKELC